MQIKLVKLPEVHGTDKSVNPNLKPEKQAVKQARKPSESHGPLGLKFNLKLT